MAAPFLKWAGGKRSLARAIAARAPACFETYREPFLGGGAVFFYLRSGERAGPAVLSDANAELIACYLAVRDGVDDVVAALRDLKREYLEDGDAGRKTAYYRIRSAESCDAAGRAARLIFLNRTGYNGLYRLNAKGRFNVPHGRYANPRIVDEEGLRLASEALQGARLEAASFEQACERAQAGDFVYLDPPYVPLSQTSTFTQYTGVRFGPTEQEALRDAFEAMTRRGVACLLSNSDHEAVRALYGGRGYGHEVVRMSRAINSVGSGRQPIGELLIDNFDRPDVRKRLRWDTLPRETRSPL